MMLTKLFGTIIYHKTSVSGESFYFIIHCVPVAFYVNLVKKMLVYYIQKKKRIR